MPENLLPKLQTFLVLMLKRFFLGWFSVIRGQEKLQIKLEALENEIDQMLSKIEEIEKFLCPVAKGEDCPIEEKE